MKSPVPPRTVSSIVGPCRQAAFTLVELLAAIAIVGILAAIIIVVVGRARTSAKASQCASNLRQIGMAAGLYHIDNKNHTPPTNNTGGNNTKLFHELLWSYAYKTPYKAATSAHNDLPNNLDGTIFECPIAQDDQTTPRRSYAMNYKLLGNDISLAERATTGVPLMRITLPSKAAYFSDVNNSSALSATSGVSSPNPRHDSKANVCYVDGHVESISMTSAQTTLTDPFWTGVPKP